MRVKEIGKATKQAIEKNKYLAKKSPGGAGYATPEESWQTYDSSLWNFGKTFNIVLPVEYSVSTEKYKLKDYIEEKLLKEKWGNLTAVEFGGPGSALFRDFSRYFFRKTVGVCLKDIRNDLQKETDEEYEHSVIEGDILDTTKVEKNKVLSEVTKKLGTNKIDLIICRMRGPLYYIDKDPAILDRIVRNWYSLLNKNGLMFIQFDIISSGSYRSTANMAKEWSVVINEKFPQIDIQFAMGDENIGNVIRLHKGVGSPEKLPPATQLF